MPNPTILSQSFSDAHFESEGVNLRNGNRNTTNG